MSSCLVTPAQKGPLGLEQGQNLPAPSHWDPASLSPQSVPSWDQGFTASPVTGKAVAVRAFPERLGRTGGRLLLHPSSMQKAVASNSREFLLTSGMWMGCPQK